MAPDGREVPDLEIRPATPDRWDDVCTLAGERGFTSGCWCMWWRLSRDEWQRTPPRQRRSALADLVAAGNAPGLLAYRGGVPVGWAALAPRDEYPRLNRSTKLEPVDDTPVWSITCFTVDRRHRRRGVAEALLDAAVDHAAARGASVVEGYPIDTAGGRRAGADLFTGTLGMFLRVGFEEVARRGGRPIVRKTVTAGGTGSRP
ncbi:MAG TPA: GNAT family N-acetyltransferase [Acidimicrobiales bacterium]